MTRIVAPALALFPAAAAWALLGASRVEWSIVLGVLALLGGLWTLAQPLDRGLRIAVAAFACLALLGPTGLRMLALAGSFRPFSWYAGLNQRDLVELTLPVASEGVWTLDKPRVPKVIVNITCRAEVLWKQRRISLDRWAGILSSWEAAVLIRCDKEIPFQHAGWVAAIAVANGHREVLLGVERFSRLPADVELGAELSLEYWPELELLFPVVPAEGPRVRVIASKWQERVWPPLPPLGKADDAPRRMEQVAAGARYELEGRGTEDLRTLAEWLRETRPASIEPDPAVPLKYVVAVQNEIRKAGHPSAALVLPVLPGGDVPMLEHLPYPAAD